MKPGAVVAVLALAAYLRATHAQAPSAAPYQVPAFVPLNYTRMFVTEDGNTQLAECQTKSEALRAYTSVLTPQALSYKQLDINATAVILDQLHAGQFQGPHNCPAPQWVSVQSGSWFIQTSQGVVRDFQLGDGLLYQDNIPSLLPNTPAMGQHSSGSLGDAPCNLLVVQVEFDAQVIDPSVTDPCPF